MEQAEVLLAKVLEGDHHMILQLDHNTAAFQNGYMCTLMLDLPSGWDMMGASLCDFSGGASAAAANPRCSTPELIEARDQYLSGTLPCADVHFTLKMDHFELVHFAF